jgi:hypothetical protein
MMCSLIAFSQTGTVTIPTKSFPVPVVKLIIKDLLSGDSAKAQLKLTEQQLFETENKVSLKDSVISIMKKKEDNYINIIDVQNQKYGVLENYTKTIESDLKTEKAKNKFKNLIMIALTALILIK